MTKQSSTKEKKARPPISAVEPSSATQAAAASETPEAPTDKPGAVSLTPIRGRRTSKSRPEKLTAKELSALAKKAARARWAERMDSEGR